MNAVRGRGLVQRFGASLALGPIDLDVAVGERVAVLGDNGAGKTSLLRILATAARPATGSLELLGLEATRHRSRLRPRLGYLAHASGLYPELTVAENLRFFATLQGVPAERVSAVLEEVALSAVAGRQAGELSRGMQQRLALARSVLHQPELLILDEPDASLDGPGRALLARLAAGRTLVMATHDRLLARSLCERAMLLRSGRAGGDPWRLLVMHG